MQAVFLPKPVLKENYDILGIKLKTDFNDAIKTGSFPKNQQNAEISPIFKSQDRHNKCNYRPVRILPAILKVTERLMFSHINAFMDKKLSIFQCGFCKGMSAQHSLLFLIEKWKKCHDTMR